MQQTTTGFTRARRPRFEWQTVKEEDTQNQELLELSHQILDLAKAIHAETPRRPAPRQRPFAA
jgi:hypothetical protein